MQARDSLRATGSVCGEPGFPGPRPFRRDCLAVLGGGERRGTGRGREGRGKGRGRSGAAAACRRGPDGVGVVAEAGIVGAEAGGLWLGEGMLAGELGGVGSWVGVEVGRGAVVAGDGRGAGRVAAIKVEDGGGEVGVGVVTAGAVRVDVDGDTDAVVVLRRGAGAVLTPLARRAAGVGCPRGGRPFLRVGSGG